MTTFAGVVEFVAVVECQGFSAAAKRLACSTSYVSRQVAQLESRLGCALLARTTRTVNLTEAGQAYYQECCDLINGFEQAQEQITQSQLQLSGVLRVSAAGTFAEQYIVPALIDFAKLHPALNIDIDLNSKMSNLVEQGIDFAIRYGQLNDSSLVAQKLVQRQLVAVASSSYLANYGVPTHPHALKEHQCIITNSDVWRFQEQGAEVLVKVKGRWRSNSGQAVVQACLADMGIAYMPKTSFTDALAQGQLQPVLAQYWSAAVTSWIVYQNRRHLPLKARLAIDFLRQRFANWQE